MGRESEWTGNTNHPSAAIKWRWIFFFLIIMLMPAILAVRFFILQIRQGEDYQAAFEEQIRREQRKQGMRGLIYDRDGELLAYNELAYSITMSDNGYYNSRQERNDTLNQEIARVIQLVCDTGGEYEALVSGQSDPYEFIRELIRTLRLTPAQLALDPCTASCVITEPDTGRVLACVTYPGYDNNRLANTIDGDYYEQLLNDQSLPLYNNASQQRTAPGSTFKPITAISALAEGMIDSSTRIEDQGRFELITPSPRCWIHASGRSHGEINVQEAIRDSCNYFFYTLGYEMSLENGSYHEEQGIETLQQYTELFGLNETSGIELPENSPQIADSFPVTAAIGQSNHNYTTTQLARYASVLANRGSLYELTLVGAVEDGMLGEQAVQELVLTRQLDEISPDLWETISGGMEMMAADNRALGELSIPIAGKTGTAQQTAGRPNHALFVGYAPAEEPQIAVAARIAYGYSSANAVDVAADVVRYYFGLAPEEEILTGTADTSIVSGNVTAD